MLSKKQVKNVCLHTNHKASPEDMCRYCHCEYFAGEFNCVKLSSKKKKVDADISSQIAAGHHPSTIPFSSDNCKGFPLLRSVKQGYDI
jgi:hypothetical protein